MVLSLDVILWRIRDILAMREEFPQKSIDVFIGPALPWMVRSRKVEYHTVQLLSELRMYCASKSCKLLFNIIIVVTFFSKNMFTRRNLAC